MPYLSFSLKYRPRRFDDVVGQEHVAKTLKNALTHDRLAHAYLFTGPRGTGKTSTARILAAALNCIEGPTPEPCGVCDMCLAITQGNAMDTIEIDAASTRGIQDMRDLLEKVKFTPAQGQYKIYILDEAHQLTPEANNALLKTLEEPPRHVVFLLLTTEAHKIMPTILSRCQHFEFRAITMADIARSLRRIAEQEQVEVDDAALMAIAQAAEGGMRDAQSIFDQVVAYADGPIDLQLVHDVLGVTDQELLSSITEQIIAADITGCFASVDQAVSEGKDLVRLAEHLTVYFRDLLRIQVVGDAASGLSTTADPTEAMRAQARSLGAPRLLQAIRALAELQGQLKHSSQQALLVEISLAQLCVPSQHQTEQTAPPSISSAPTNAVGSDTVAAPKQHPPRPHPAPPPTASATPKKASRPVTSKAVRESAPPPSPQSIVAADSDLSLATLTDHWPTMYDELKRMGHMPIGGILRDGTPVALQGNVITIGFLAQFHLNKIENEYKSIVEQAAERLYARPLKIQCRLFDNAEQLRAAIQAEPTTASPVRPEQTGPAATAENQAADPAHPKPEPPPGNNATADTPESAKSAEHTPMTPDQAVEQTLSLFEGSVEVTDTSDEETD
jgi:DNA polymerase-3 subunit gamma/tau